MLNEDDDLPEPGEFEKCINVDTRSAFLLRRTLELHQKRIKHFLTSIRQYENVTIVTITAKMVGIPMLNLVAMRGIFERKKHDSMPLVLKIQIVLESHGFI